MPIQPTTPITIPERTADQIWVLSVQILAPSAQAPVRALITVAPFISETGEILKDMAKQIPIDDLYAEAATDEVIAQGIQGVYAAVQKKITDLQLF